VAALLARGLRCPPSTAAGRWFDAAAAALGLAPPVQAEAEAAIALEQAATQWLEVHALPALPALPAPSLDLHALVGDLFDETEPGRGAARFHGALAEGLVDAAAAHGATRLVLAGGCFHNRLLSRLVTQGAAARGIACLRPTTVDCGDAGLALGQAWLAAHAVETDRCAWPCPPA
jgi:hydrogenase maturation protein HypF